MPQNLTTNIVINAKTGNGFGKVGATLTEMGMIVEGISQKLIDFGTDSVKVYREYEMSLKDAEVALSTTYGRGTQQLRTVMEQLDTAATNWAATTIFHTNDVANAISEAAHAGWDLDQIMEGVPEAMELAQAGSIDLSEALDYMVKSTYAAGIGFDELDHFTDIWTFAANKSATTIGEVGEAMLRMGSTMRFAADPEELMTLIAVMANSGYVGSEAGTLIRNSMMRLIAPTDKAEDALAEMGASAEELGEIVSDEKLQDAYRRLSEHGFQGLYDERGQMRSVLDVYSEMATILGDMAGGMDKISGNKEAMDILSSIFPTRSITGALNLMNAAANEYGGLYDSLMGGEAEGYGAYAAETMMDSLNGRIETFESKVERLKQITGEALSPFLERGTEIGGEWIDRIAAMDPGAFNGMVDGLLAVAAAGPAMLTAGAAFRLLGLAATPVGFGALALTGALTGLAVLNGKVVRDFENQFGSMELDPKELQDFLEGIEEGFAESRRELDQWSAATEQAAQSYEAAGATLSQRLSSAMITGGTLSEADYASISANVDQMIDAGLETIRSRAQEANAYWRMLFGGTDSPYLRELSEAIERQTGELTSEAEAAGEALHEALFKAYSNDGQISPDELEDIQSYVRAYNDAVAEAMAADEERRSQAAISAKLHKAQSASLDTVKQYAEEISQSRDELLETEYGKFLENWYYANGLDVSEESLQAAEEAWLTRKAEITAPYDNALLRLYGMLRSEGELSPGDYAHTLALEHAALGGDASISETAAAYRAAAEAGAEGMDAALSALEAHQAAYDAAGITATSRVWWNPLTWFKGFETKQDQTAWADAIGRATYGDSYVPIAQQEAERAYWQRWAAEQREADALRESLEFSVGGDFTELDRGLQERNGTQLAVELVPAGTGVLSGGFSGVFGKFAEGGRATEPSIFGEGDLPEWAIPEEHSERTAALLNAARAASGFTWPDLLARFGGLNANPSHVPTTIVYSPVIHAGDASGVDAVLREDKKRMDRWFREKQMRDAAEIYA